MSTELPEPHAFAAELAKRRHKASLTQRDLATLSGTSESGLRRLEKGWEDLGKGARRVTPSINILVKLAAALDWDPRSAARLAGYKPSEVPPAVEKVAPPPMLYQYWARLTTKQRDLIEAVVKEFAASNVDDNRTSEAQLY